MGNDAYFMACLSAAAETMPSLIKDMFVTTVPNAQGIIGLRYFIRGKPYVISIDTEFLFENTADPTLVYGGTDAGKTAMWAAILEKGWAKIKGNYDRIQSGSAFDSMRVITGAPSYVDDLSI